MTVDLKSLRRFAVPAINRDADTVVRASTLLALVDAVEAAQGIAYVFVCRCDEAWTGRGLHDPACLADEGADLLAALAPFREQP